MVDMLEQLLIKYRFTVRIFSLNLGKNPVLSLYTNVLDILILVVLVTTF